MAKIVECKTCGKEISSGAKKCPHCGQKRGGIVGKIVMWAIVGVVGLGIATALLGDPDDSSTRATKGSPAKPETIYSIGDSVRSGDFSITINNVSTRSSVGSSFIEEVAGDGGIFVVVNFSYRNETREPVGAFSVPDIELRDPHGVKYSQDIGASSSYATERDLNTNAFSDINPGIQVNDASVFEVSKSAFEIGGWTVYVDNGRNDFQVVIP